MKIAIIGAGFTGLSAAYYLQQAGFEVTIFEKDIQPGGLAIGYQEKGWDWTLEKHYHHWFTNDAFVLDLAKEINHQVIIKRPKTSVYLRKKSYPLDSPQAMLTFPLLPFVDRVRMIATLAFLKLNPFWKPLEKVKAMPIMPKLMGAKAWELLWLPQLTNKMGTFAKDISLVWFWTRINKRTPSLAYPKGGFLSFATHLAEVITNKGGKIYYDMQTTLIESGEKPSLEYKDSKGAIHKESFDQILVTLPSFLFLKLTPSLPEAYRSKLTRLQGLSATNLVLRMKKPFLTDKTYWLSICEKNSPVMVLVEHTNLMDKKNYNNEHLMYIGNYAATDDKLDWTKEKLLEWYDPVLTRLNPDYKNNLIDSQLFIAPFAQPIIPTNYSKLLPAMDTPLKNVFLANIEQVYPWDRGTNYAVELGKNIAKHMLKTS